MLFSSPIFFFFFACYLLLHVLLPLKFRLPLVIVGSSIFYGFWNPAYLWLPFFLMLIAYVGAIWVTDTSSGSQCKRAMLIVIASLLTPLAIVKYTNFVYQDVLGPFLGFQGKLTEWDLPLGISFITFTLIAYVVDVYQGRYRAERNPLMLGGLVLFFPHLIAGPILRPSELLPQLRRPGRRFRTRLVFGLAIFTVGLVKKLVLADPMSEYVENAFLPNANGLSGMDYLLGIYGFSVQIYCDFSGYTDMALGTALALGVKLPNNFERPYVAASIVDFWKRWHITLSRWLRDYIYLPLGGNRLGFRRQIGNLVLTMGLGGLWHGANWTFVLWGLVHAAGIGYVHGISRAPALRFLQRVPEWIKIMATFHFVSGAWILFRASDLSVAKTVALGPFHAPWDGLTVWLSHRAFPLLILVTFFLLHRFDSHRMIRKLTAKTPQAIFWPVVLVIWLLCISFSQGSSAKFIYFDF